MSVWRGRDWGIAYGFLRSVILVEITKAYSCFVINDFQGESRVQSDTLQVSDIDFFLLTALVLDVFSGSQSGIPRCSTLA